MRVVRFYQSCSSPPPPSPPASPPPPFASTPMFTSACQLFAKLFANFRTQWALLDLNCKGLSALGTAGPQPGTFRAQDLNLGPPEHRWISTWDPPSSVSTAGPQRPDTEDMPDRTPDRMSERMPEDMPDKVPECLPDRMPEDMPDRMPEGMPDRMSDRMPEDLPDRMPDRMSEDMPEDMPDRVPEDMPEHIAEDMPDRMPTDMPDKMPEDMPDKMPDRMSDRMPEDLPVTKRIDVMVGITRSKVIDSFLGLLYPHAHYPQHPT